MQDRFPIRAIRPTEPSETTRDSKRGLRFLQDAGPIYTELDNKKISRLGVVGLNGNSHENITVPLSFRPRRLFLCAYEDVLANIDGR